MKIQLEAPKVCPNCETRNCIVPDERRGWWRCTVAGCHHSFYRSGVDESKLINRRCKICGLTAKGHKVVLIDDPRVVNGMAALYVDLTRVTDDDTIILNIEATIPFAHQDEIDSECKLQGVYRLHDLITDLTREMVLQQVVCDHDWEGED